MARFGVLSILLIAFAIAGPQRAIADVTAQFALGGFRAPDDPNVNGFRFALLYGENDDMDGLDLGVLSVNESSTLSGVAMVFGVHKLTGGMEGGAAFSLVNVHGGDDAGLNAAFINIVENVEDGLNFGFVNIAGGTTLVDIGGFNMASRSTAQVGFINVTDEITGFQLGFLNIAKNGFFPVFPFFNFPKK